jgi:hypothetical protein
MGKKFTGGAPTLRNNTARGGREPRQRPGSNTPGITARWPELRVIRFPDANHGKDIDDWHIFLDDIGGPRNYGKGDARTLGSLAITYITAKEFGLMLETKYGNGKDYNTPEKAARLIAKMQTGLRVFMQEAHKNAYDNRTDSIHDKISDIVVASAFSAGDTSYVPLGRSEELAEFEADIAGAVEAGQTAPIWFDDAELVVNGLAQYGEGYGLDLTLNEVLFEERSALLDYLRTYEKLNTGKYTNSGWLPHATVFKFEDHIRSASITYGESLPSVISYNHPTAL